MLFIRGKHQKNIWTKICQHSKHLRVKTLLKMTVLLCASKDLQTFSSQLGNVASKDILRQSKYVHNFQVFSLFPILSFQDKNHSIMTNFYNLETLSSQIFLTNCFACLDIKTNCFIDMSHPLLQEIHGIVC